MQIKCLITTILALFLFSSFTLVSYAEESTEDIPQGINSEVLNKASYFGDTDPSILISVDIVLKIDHKLSLEKLINDSTNPSNRNFRKYLTVKQFQEQFAPAKNESDKIIKYLEAFGVKSELLANHFIIHSVGTVEQFNNAFSVKLKDAELRGRKFHSPKSNPRLPSIYKKGIVCILGLNNFTHLNKNAVKQTNEVIHHSLPGSLKLYPRDLIEHYNVQPLYDNGNTGKGQTIGIISLSEFNPEDAFTFWNNIGINSKKDRIGVIQIDGGSSWDGYDETTLDVQQSGALAPDAQIKVFIGPNSDVGFVNTYAAAINDNVAQQISVSWGENEAHLSSTPEIAEVFNQMNMQASAQGISMFAASGDSGAYDAVNNSPAVYKNTVDMPADSPFITAAGGTTLPVHLTFEFYNFSAQIKKERAWGQDYMYPFYDSAGLNSPDEWGYYYFSGGGGGISDFYQTPNYQKGIPGVNQFTAIQYWQPSPDYSSVARIENPSFIEGHGNGRNVPDLSMNADPNTGYSVLLSDPGSPGKNSYEFIYGGTSFVAPQLCGISALINSMGNQRIGFWNPQIYRYAQMSDSPFTPLNSKEDNNNLYYAGTENTIYNQSTGLGIPDITKLAKQFHVKTSH